MCAASTSGGVRVVAGVRRVLRPATTSEHMSSQRLFCQRHQMLLLDMQRSIPLLLLLLMVCNWHPVAGESNDKRLTKLDLRFRNETFLSDELPARNTGLTAALVLALRQLSYGTPKVHILPVMATVGKMIEYGVLYVLRNFAEHQGSIFVSQKDSKESNKWARLSTCKLHSAWHCLFGQQPSPSASEHARLPAQQRAPFAHQDLGRACEVMKWESEEDQIIFAGAIAASLAPDIYHSPDAVVRVVNVPSETDVNISLHGRFTDACDYETTETRKYGTMLWSDPRGRPCFSFEIYMRELEFICTKYRTRNVLVATDSQEFLDYLLANKKYNYIYMKGNRSGFKRTQSAHHGWIDNRPDLTPDMVDSTVADMWLLQYGHVLLGGLAGHFSRALYFLMAGQLGYAPRFRSLDGQAPIWSPLREFDFVDSAVHGREANHPWEASEQGSIAVAAWHMCGALPLFPPSLHPNVTAPVKV